MEIIVYVCLMIVPILSVAAFILSLLAMGKFKKLQSLVINLGKSIRRTNDPVQQALNDYEVSGI